jgi:hypothetical protein
MASTPWAMKPRIALIWFSCFCCASANFRSMPRFHFHLGDGGFCGAPAGFEPICEKPTAPCRERR